VDLILLNGNIIPMAVPGRRRQALAVKDGKIYDVDDSAAIERLQGAQTEVIDLQGKTVLPGFIDSHMHATITGLGLSSARLEAAASVADVCEHIHRRAQKTPPGKWVFGVSCVPWALKENRFPTMTELDRVSEGHPVYIMSATCHSGAANSKGFQFIDIDTSLPGVEKDQGTGQPTGSFLSDDTHYFALGKAVSTLTDDEITGFYHDVCDLAASLGVTTLHCLDGQLFADDRDVDIFTRIQGELPIHTVLMYQTMDIQKVLDMGLPRIGGCLTIDGSSFEHTALYYEPYADSPDVCGDLYFMEEDIEAFVRDAHRAGLQIGMHAIGDRAVDILVKAFQKAQAAYPRDDCRHRVEHFITPTDWAMDAAVELGLAFPMQPVFPYLWDEPQKSEYVRLVGAQRADRMEPFCEILNRGGIISGGSDSPVTDINPLLGIHAGVNMPNPVRRVPVEEALRMFTVNGAWVAKEEDRKGTIEQGKLADLVVLDRDPFREPEQIKNFAVEMTIAGGKIVYRK
jgi:predicted amidohydrolase YtcJ